MTRIPSTEVHLQQNDLKSKESVILIIIYTVILNQSPDLNLVEMLQRFFQRDASEYIPVNVKELQQHCKDDWAKNLLQQCDSSQTVSAFWFNFR